MSRFLTSRMLWLVLIVAGAAAFAGAQSTIRPGDPTQARVWVENRTPNEAIPVAVERMNGTANVHLSSVDASLVLPSRVTRQRWEYRAMAYEAAALEQAGNEGWEAIGMLQTNTNGPAVSVLLKRPR